MTKKENQDKVQNNPAISRLIILKAEIFDIVRQSEIFDNIRKQKILELEKLERELKKQNI